MFVYMFVCFYIVSYLFRGGIPVEHVITASMYDYSTILVALGNGHSLAYPFFMYVLKFFHAYTVHLLSYWFL